WTHMELNNPFGIHELLNPSSAKNIYAQTKEQLKDANFSTQNLLTRSNVEMVGTTDDPIDHLTFHKRLNENHDFKTKVVPTSRPDQVFQISKGDKFRSYLQKLSDSSGIQVDHIDSLLQELDQRINYFGALGCVASDHGLKYLPKRGR